LIKFAELLKLPSVIAGVTLIALANGAGDVITSISSGGDDGSVGLVLSTIYGSGIFS
jgi:Ca2+/Na+ antiporter